MSAKIVLLGLALAATAAASPIAAVDEIAAPPAVVGENTEAEPLLGKINCKKAREQIGPCSVEFNVCGRISKFKWVYDSTACASGKCAKSSGFKSGKGAAEDSAKKLFAMGPACAIPPQQFQLAAGPETVVSIDELDETPEAESEAVAVAETEETPLLGKINCKKAREQIGPCSVEFNVCGRISKFKWVYDSTACASGKCAKSSGFKSGKGAAEDSAKKLFAMAPACAIPPQ